MKEEKAEKTERKKKDDRKQGIIFLYHSREILVIAAHPSRCSSLINEQKLSHKLIKAEPNGDWTEETGPQTDLGA